MSVHIEPEEAAMFREALAQLPVDLRNAITRGIAAILREINILYNEQGFQRQINMRNFIETVQRDVIPSEIVAAKREEVRDAGREGNKRYDAIWAEIEPVLADIRPLGLKGNAEAAKVLDRLGREGIKRLNISGTVEAMAKRIARRRQGKK